MTQDSNRRFAVVTGAASGIGRATAIALADRGIAVAIADIDVVGASAVADEIKAAGGSAKAFDVDVTSRDSVQALHEAVRDQLGIAEVVINGAGWNEGTPFLDNGPDFMKRVIDLNLMGPIWLCQEFLRPLVAAGMPGTVVNVSSDAGRVGSMGETVYAAAKGGLIAFTKSLAREMARHKITANCIAPGPTDTPLFHRQPENIRSALIRATPLRKLAKPEDVAFAIVFLASEQATHITGQVMSVSGGLTMVG